MSEIREYEETTAKVARRRRSSATLGEKKIRNKKRELAEKITED